MDGASPNDYVEFAGNVKTRISRNSWQKMLTRVLVEP